MGVFDGIMLARTGAGYLESLIFRQSKTIAVLPVSQSAPAGTKGQEVEADVIFSYNYKSPVKITENPVENGVIVNDHRIIQPKVITMDVGISNIVGIADIASNRDIGTVIQASKIFIFGNRFDSKSRIAAKYTDLLIAEYNGDVFTLVTPLGLFKNMLIVDIDCTQDPDSISVFRGRITYKELLEFVTGDDKLTDLSGVNPLAKNGLAMPETISPSLLPSKVAF
jgi:hypothetical protein